MNFYLLSRIGETDYDTYEGFVVRASSEEHARTLAHELPQDENDWMDANKTKCLKLFEDGYATVILGAFRAG